ncbi:hypothetical protein NX774_20455 [Massilia agilis]|uniref:PPM-type phosphatase domain-containing protein n=1 Tax=Massilia agilis TaxID=1811226 RepID=A0ABT2DG48_9BURK|nr:hypothetical protein [Massilia agilis]MCS0810301.1 hypothetical protein [Massilia agilis]
MTIDTVSSPGHGDHNEDLIAVFEQEGWTDIVIIDGGSSVADRDYVDAQQGDVVWFVREFARALAHTASAGRRQEDSVRLALDQVRRVFDEKTHAVAVPMYAWPIAAMTWVRIWHERGHTALQAWCVGDCKTLLRLPGGAVLDLDPYVNAQEGIVRDEIAKLASQGITDPATRRERLLPMLRARREFQNSTAAPISLCLAPGGPFDAREFNLEVEAGSVLLMMTDGFYRLVDPYGLYTDEQLAAACATRGAAALVGELRAFELGGATGMSVKNADDASAVIRAFP